MNFVFYDTETTGTDTTFDQILQFAALLTDENLVELDHFEIRCRLQPHVVPHPKALLVTRIRPGELDDPALPSHYEAMRRIAARFKEWSPAVFAGYNSLSFDEALLRQAFYQTLQPVYVTNSNDNRRADILRLVQAAEVYAPNSIVVPLTGNGRRNRRLDVVAPANGYDHAGAHEAMADVLATVHIARLIRDRAPQVWEQMMHLTSKQDVREILQPGELLSFTEVHYGRSCSWLVTACGEDPAWDAQQAVFDLRHDPRDHLEKSAGDLVEVLNAKQKIIRSLRANAQPILLDPAHAIDGLHPPDTDTALERARLIADSPGFRTRVGEALSQRYPPREPSAHLEGRIYDGFYGAGDRQIAEEFHRLPWEERYARLGGASDDRLAKLGARLIWQEHPETLPADVRREMDEWHAERLSGAGREWTGLADALSAADRLIADGPGEEDAGRLREIREWLVSRGAGIGD